jgi:hypothetical protein
MNNKYNIVNDLLTEGWWGGTSKEEDEHIRQQKAREKEWATKGKITGSLAGAGAGGYVANKVFDATKGQKWGLTKAAGAGLATAIGGRILGKKIGYLIARMTRQGYTKPQIQQAVQQIKARGF